MHLETHLSSILTPLLNDDGEQILRLIIVKIGIITMKSHLRIGGKIVQPVAAKPVHHVDLPEAFAIIGHV